MPEKILAALRAQYLELDRRLLAVFRIYFALVLLADLLQKAPHLAMFFTNDGILPNHFALFAPFTQPLFSLFFACSTKGEIEVAFALAALVYLGLLVGYRTRLMQILTLILYTSLVSRNLFFEMGGSSAMALAATWTVFLPLGDRFSIDALRRSLARREEKNAAALNDRAEVRPDRTPHVSIVTLGLLVQVTAIYFFNGVQKGGEDWRTGQAVHWVLWQDRIATSLCGLLRMHEPAWLSPFFTWGTLVIEETSPLMLLTPFVWRWSRSIFVPLAVSLHAGIALLVDVGPYSYIMFAFDLLVLPAFWFDRGATWLRKGKVPRTVVYDPGAPGVHGIMRVLARLDTFELLRFVDRGEASSSTDLAGLPASSIAVLRSGGAFTEGRDAVVDALGATPLGRLFGWLPLRWMVGALVRFRAPIVQYWPWPSRSTLDDAGEPGRGVRLHRSSAVFLRESLAGALAIVVITQMLHDNWWLDGKIPASVRRGPPGALALVPGYLRHNQGWGMFREGPHWDGTLIVDGETVDGRHIDPFTGKPPDFDVAFHGPIRVGFLFYEYFRKIADPGNTRYRAPLASYLMNWQRVEGRPPRDRLVAFRVLWVERASPPFGQTRPMNAQSTVFLAGP